MLAFIVGVRFVFGFIAIYYPISILAYGDSGRYTVFTVLAIFSVFSGDTLYTLNTLFTLRSWGSTARRK